MRKEYLREMFDCTFCKSNMGTCVLKIRDSYIDCVSTTLLDIAVFPQLTQLKQYKDFPRCRNKIKIPNAI